MSIDSSSSNEAQEDGSLDKDFAGQSEKLSLSSICDDAESHKFPLRHSKSAPELSNESTDDSYSVDDDFASSSRQGQLWEVTSSSPNFHHQCDVPTFPDASCDDIGEGDLPIPINIPQQPGTALKTCMNQKNPEECKYDLDTIADSVERIDNVLSTGDCRQTDGDAIDEDNFKTDGYEYIGLIEPTVNDNALPMHRTASESTGTPVSVESKGGLRCSNLREASKPPLCHDAHTQTQPEIQSCYEQSMWATKLKPASFVPRCAYVQTKSMRIQRGQIEREKEKPAKICRYSKRRLEQLAKPFKRYEIENIQPGTASEIITGKSKKKSVDYVSDYGEHFLDRMESMERQRQEKLARAAAEAAYNARSDRKVCFNCGTIQSYGEMIEDRDTCQSDGCKSSSAKYFYQSPKRFVLKNFEQRMERSSQRRGIILDKIEEERRLSIIHTSQRRSRRQKELQDKVSREGNDFNTRMARDIEARKMKIQCLERTQDELLRKQHSFKPTLNIPEHLIRHRREFDWDSLATPVRRHTDEYHPPQKSRKKNKTRRRKKPLELPWQSRYTKPERNVDEEKIRQKFQQMIM